MNPQQIEENFSNEMLNIRNEYKNKVDQLTEEFREKKVVLNQNYLLQLKQYKNANVGKKLWKVCGPYEEYKNVEYETILIIYTSEEKAKTVLENSKQRIVRTTIDELPFEQLKYIDDFSLEDEMEIKFNK